jgi:aspartokinase-like uncharacterized kinase
MTVVKIGGGLMARVESFDAVLAEIVAASWEVPLLIVPGGGPFADAVRDADRRIGLSDDAAHWMAILAMDQYAHLLLSRVPRGRLVRRPNEIELALTGGMVPVLAPYVWLHDADPLPHSWDVTSDSISAWVAEQVNAERLVLVKPAGAAGPAIVDRWLDRILPPHIQVDIVTADRLDVLRSALQASQQPSRDA